MTIFIIKNCIYNIVGMYSSMRNSFTILCKLELSRNKLRCSEYDLLWIDILKPSMKAA